MNRESVKKLAVVGALVVSGLAVPSFAFAQAQEPSYCNLVTPTVRDVVQEAPAIAAVLNLDPALPDAEIQTQRDRLGCGPAPVQTEDQARGELCAVLTEARVEDLVTELNNPDATRGLEAIRPALGIIIGQSRDQLNCDAAGAPVQSDDKTPVTAPTAGNTNDDGDTVVTAPDGEAAVDADGDGVAVTKGGQQVVVTPRGSAQTGWL
jgi:hypothetical protein